MAGHLAHHPQLVMTIVPWAAHVAWAHEDAGQMIMDFRRAPWKGNLASNAIAPVGKVVETAGVRSSTNFDRPERIDLDFLPPLAGGSSAEARRLQEAVLLHQQLGGLGEVYGDL